MKVKYINVLRGNKGLTRSLADGVGLPAVLGNFIVDEADNVGPDGSLEDGGEADRRLGRVTLLVVHGNQRTSRS